MNKRGLIIRDFTEADADACFRIRSAGFIRNFAGYVTPEQIAALVNSWMPSDFVRMSEKMQWLVCEDRDGVAGFCTIKFLDETTAEILFLYVKPDRHRMGIGSRLLDAAVEWLKRNRPETSRVVLDTVVPRYNRAFYEKHGFEVTGNQTCIRDGLEIPSVVMSRRLHA
jgi:ribosomal protein S18 acetylase RimI-like enzyme